MLKCGVVYEFAPRRIAKKKTISLIGETINL
jgi:hypothetical protein